MEYWKIDTLQYSMADDPLYKSYVNDDEIQTMAVIIQLADAFHGPDAN